MGVHLGHGGRRFPVTLDDPVRIVQDAYRGTEAGRRYERNIIVIPELTKEVAEREIEDYGRAGVFRWLLS